MNFKMFDKWKSFGHMSNVAKTVIFITISVIVLTTLYIAFTKEASRVHTKEKVVNLDNTTNISESEIAQIRKSVGGLWFKNYIWIQGQQYELYYGENGNIQVKKNGKLVDISTIIGSDGAIINKDGKMYFYTEDGQLIDLESGDVVETAGKIYQIKDDNKISDYISDDLFVENGQLKYIDDFGNGQSLEESAVVTIDGIPMKYMNGILRPLNNYSSALVDDAYVGKMNSSGGIDYFQKKGNTLVKIDKKDILEDAIVDIDGTKMRMINDDLVSIEDADFGITTIDDVTTMKDGDNLVEMDRGGKPLYYKIVNGKLVVLDAKNIPVSTLVFYKSKPYIKMDDGKLQPFKEEIGKPFIKKGKVLAIDSTGKPMFMKTGEIIDFKDKKYVVSPDGKILPLTYEMEKELEKYPNRLLLQNGEKKLIAEKGQVKEIKPSNILFRGGVPYKLVDGKLIKVSKKELEMLEEKGKEIEKSQAKKSLPSQPNFDSKLKATYYGDENIKEKESFYISNGQIKSSITIPNINKKQGTDDLDAERASRNKAIDNMLDNSSMTPATPYEKQNNQEGKRNFIDKNRKKGDVGAVVYPSSPYTLSVGTIIDATMKTGINSDLPGNIYAVVNTNVYDSLSHNYLLIPSGTRVFGAYSSDVSYGQKRIVMVWNKLILPNGFEVELAGQQGYDLSGMSGLKGEVDNHYYELFKNVALMSLFGAGAQYAAGLAGGGGIDGVQLVAASIGQQIGQTGIELIQKTMNIQPTIEIYAGQRFKILLDTNLVFENAYQFYKPLNFKR